MLFRSGHQFGFVVVVFGEGGVRMIGDRTCGDVLNRVRAGDKSPTQHEITEALIVSGDITSWLSPLAKEQE